MRTYILAIYIYVINDQTEHLFYTRLWIQVTYAHIHEPRKPKNIDFVHFCVVGYLIINMVRLNKL